MSIAVECEYEDGSRKIVGRGFPSLSTAADFCRTFPDKHHAKLLPSGVSPIFLRVFDGDELQLTINVGTERPLGFSVVPTFRITQRGEARLMPTPGQSWFQRIFSACHAKLWIFLVGSLLVPLIAMQFTTEVNWGLADFAFASLLLFSLAICIELALWRVQRRIPRVVAVFAVAGMHAVFWADAAVGVFD